MPEANSIEHTRRATQAIRKEELLFEEEDCWQLGLFQIVKLSQDERLVRFAEGTIIRGLDASGQDPQSDAAFALTGKGILWSIWDDVVQAMHSQLRRHWHSVEPIAETIVDLDAQSLQAKPDDEVSIVDESADKWTPERLAEELLELDVKHDWTELRELILLAEDTGFTVEQSAQLAPRLLQLATAYRDSNDPRDEPVVWSAIRRGASMLRPQEAHRLLPLLEPGHAIETSLVTLKMLGRIFEAQPPYEADEYPDLAVKVGEIAKALLNPFVIITSSKSAAMAQLAIFALAAMASSDTLIIVEFARRLGVDWFVKQTGRELRELRKHWDDRPSAIAFAPRELLSQVLRVIDAN